MSDKVKTPALSIREQILAMSAKVFDKPITLKGIDGDIYVKVLSAADRERMEPDFNEEQNNYKTRALVFQQTLCDKDGNLLFSKEDVDALAQLQFGLINEGFTKSNEINGINIDAVDDAEKNS